MLPKKKPLKRLQPKRAGGTRPKAISDELLKKLKNIIMREKKTPDLKRKIGEIMSPGKMKAITGRNPGEMKKRSGIDKRIKLGGMAGMSRAVLNEVKRLKPSGRPSRSDIKRAREMLKKRKGK